MKHHTLKQILEAALYAFNAIPRKAPRGMPHGFKDTYELASALEKQIGALPEADITHAVTLLTSYLLDTVPCEEPWEDACPEVDEARTILQNIANAP